MWQTFKHLINQFCIIALTVLFNFAAMAAGPQCHRLFLSQIDGSALNQNSYIQGRRLFRTQAGDDIRGSYEGSFGDGFIKDILNLGLEDVWLDGGAGSFAAQADYVDWMQKNKMQPARMTAIVHQLSKDTRPLESLSEQVNQGRFVPLIGKLVEEVDEVAPNSVTVVTDVFGAYSYSRRPDLVLAKYLSWLKTGGRIYIAQSPPNQTRRGYDIFQSGSMYIQGTVEIKRQVEKKSFFGLRKTMEEKVETKEHSGLSFVTWLEQIHGIQFRIGYGTITIDKISDQIEIPQLKEISSSQSYPPVRYFKIEKD